MTSFMREKNMDTFLNVSAIAGFIICNVFEFDHQRLDNIIYRMSQLIMTSSLDDKHDDTEIAERIGDYILSFNIELDKCEAILKSLANGSSTLPDRVNIEVIISTIHEMEQKIPEGWRRKGKPVLNGAAPTESELRDIFREEDPHATSLST